MDISQALAADSDEMVAADLIGSPPRAFTITDVDEVVREGKTVARIYLAEFPRPWLASKGMARVMADNWTVETQNWIGRKVELYGDPDVYFGKEKRGGIRIRRLSGIAKPKTTRINPRGGKSSTWTVDPLPDTPAPSTPSPTANLLAEIKAAAEAAGVDLATVAAEWAESHEGQAIREATDVGGLKLLRDDLRGRAS